MVSQDVNVGVQPFFNHWHGSYLVLFSVFLLSDAFCSLPNFYPTWYFLFCLHAFTISAEDEKIGKKEKRPEKSLESSPNTSVEDGEVKPEAKGQDSGTSLKRAYSLSDLNKPNVPRRILPAPPANGNF